MEEILSILPKAWSGEPFRHQGKIYDLPELAVRPRPSKHIQILIGGGAEPAIRRAARLADGIYANTPRSTFLQQLDWIRDECDRVGRDPSELRIVHYSVMLPANSAAEALAVRGEFEGAILAYQTAIQNVPGDGEAYLRIARIYRDGLKKPEEALLWFRRAVTEAKLSKGQELLTRREMAEFLIHDLHEPRRAAPDLARLAEAYPDTRDGQWAKEELARIKEEMAREEGVAPDMEVVRDAERIRDAEIDRED